jgi:hypothetical protein
MEKKVKIFPSFQTNAMTRRACTTKLHTALFNSVHSKLECLSMSLFYSIYICRKGRSITTRGTFLACAVIFTPTWGSYITRACVTLSRASYYAGKCPMRGSGISYENAGKCHAGKKTKGK